MWKDEVEDWLDELTEDMGFEILERKDVRTYKIFMVRATATEILDGPKAWPSQYLPGVLVHGRWVDRPGEVLLIGAARYLKDAQRLHNVSTTAGVERVAASARFMMLVTTAQLKGGIKAEWDNMHRDPRQYLTYEYEEGHPEPREISGPGVPVAELQLMQVGKQALEDVTGWTEAAQGQRSNETSGAAIMRRQQASSRMYGEFTENLRKSIQQCGPDPGRGDPAREHVRHARARGGRRRRRWPGPVESPRRGRGIATGPADRFPGPWAVIRVWSRPAPCSPRRPSTSRKCWSNGARRIPRASAWCAT